MMPAMAAQIIASSGKDKSIDNRSQVTHFTLRWCICTTAQQTAIIPAIKINHNGNTCCKTTMPTMTAIFRRAVQMQD
jgi:hypothetical protein